MTPVPLLSDRPVGSEPLVIDQVYGVIPPLAASVRRVGDVQGATRQRLCRDRQRGRLHGQVRTAGDTAQRRRDGRAAGIDGCGEAGAGNGGDARVR